MIDVVLDTNALASGAVATGGTIGTLFDTWFLDRFYGVILSDHSLDELARTRRQRSRLFCSFDSPERWMVD